MIPKSERNLGLVQLATGATMISFSAVFVKLAHVGPNTAGFYRMLFGGLILFMATTFRGMRLWHGPRHLLIAAACGVFFFLDLTFWHRSIHYVGPGLATLLSNFQVFFVGGFGIIALGERLSLKLVVSVLLAMTGLYLIVGLSWSELGSTYKRGAVFGLVTAVCYAVYILTLRRMQLQTKVQSTLVNMTLISLLTALILGIEGRVEHERFLIPDLQSWAALVGYGLVSQVFGWVLISKGLSRVETSRVGLVLLLQPTLAFVWDILFFGRPTRAVEALGAFLALFAIYLGTAGKKA
jgi:drug/metabolite transporter (DMT)-like permease